MKQQVPHFKPMGKMCYFKRTELEQWLQSNRVSTMDELEQQAQTYCMSHGLTKRADKVHKERNNSKFKKGDILVTPTGIVFIYSGLQAESKGITRVGVMIRSDKNGIREFDKGDWNYSSSFDLATVRFANKKEKKDFINELHRSGKDFDFEKNIIIEYKWPQYKDIVYSVGSNGNIRTFSYDNSDTLKSLLESGNLFSTEIEAQELANKFKDLLKKK